MRAEGRSASHSRRDYETVAMSGQTADRLRVPSSASSQGQRRSVLNQGFVMDGGRTRSESNSSDRTSRSVGGGSGTSGGSSSGVGSGGVGERQNWSQDFAVYGAVGGSSGGGGGNRTNSSSSSHHPLSLSTFHPNQLHGPPTDGAPTPVNFDPASRRSPHHLDLPPSLSQPRSGSRDNLLHNEGAVGGVSPQRTFDPGYPNPYCDPLEVGDPLMTRYEDVAVFKTGGGEVLDRDPSSQVSSSTDSGYGHGHHIYERIGDFQMQRRSGDNSSSSSIVMLGCISVITLLCLLELRDDR